MSPLAQYASFLVRLWRQCDLIEGVRTSSWQSEVEYIQSGQTWRFASLEDLGMFLRSEAVALENLEWTESQDTGP